MTHGLGPGKPGPRAAKPITPPYVENNYRIEVKITFMLIAYLVLLCEFFWEFSIFHFCRPLVHIYWHPLLNCEHVTSRDEGFWCLLLFALYLMFLFSGNMTNIFMQCFSHHHLVNGFDYWQIVVNASSISQSYFRVVRPIHNSFALAHSWSCRGSKETYQKACSTCKICCFA